MKNTINLFLCLFLSGILSAQQISGNVSSDDGPLPGATVLVKGTNTGTSTDFDGNFKIRVSSGQKLEISSIGFSRQTIEINDQEDLDVTLKLKKQKSQLI